MVKEIYIMASIYLFSGPLIGSLIALFICLNANTLATYFKLMDYPDLRKTHPIATPLLGGLVLLFAFTSVATFYIISYSSSRWMSTLLVWVGCIIAMSVVGIADDRHSLSPRLRLLISIAVFASAAAFDPVFNVRVLDVKYLNLNWGLGTWWTSIIFTTVCCVGLTNAVNMADGKNGLVIGLCLGWLLLLSLRAPHDLLPYIVLLASILIILLIFNLTGKLFLGDGGAYGLASALALMAIMIYNSLGPHASRPVWADELVIMFAVPVIDSFRLTFLRLKMGRSPMSADRNHLHHLLLDKLGWPTSLIAYLMIAILPAFAVMVLAPSLID